MVKVYYDFQCKEDFIVYLGLIIENLQKCIIRMKRYTKDVESICLNVYKEYDANATAVNTEYLQELINLEDYQDIRKKFKPIPYYKYIELSDRINYISLKIMNLIGDRTKEAVSYRKFLDSMKSYNKKNTENPIELSNLNEKILNLLNRCYRSRNYLAHVGDSVFLSQKEYRQKQIVDLKETTNIDLGKFTEHNIYINRFEYVDVEWMFQLYLANKNSLSLFSTIIQQIKRDYSKLTGRKVELQNLQGSVLPFNFAKISLDSIDMQGI